jgi:hypothetical protein
LGQQSVLHAVKSRPSPKKPGLESSSEGSRPLNETLIDLQLSDHERHNLKTDAGAYIHYDFVSRFMIFESQMYHKLKLKIHDRTWLYMSD